jgi:hypothetical protein
VAAVLLLVASAVIGAAASASPAPAASGHPKLAPVLSTAVADNAAPSSPDSPTRPSDRRLVEVRGHDLAATKAAIVAAGGEVRLSPPGSLLASVPNANLGALSDDSRVDFVTLPRPVHADATSEGVDNTGSGRVGSTGAQTWIDAGRRGAGVKVAIVDVGFDTYQTEQAQGRLPLNMTTRNFCGPGIVGFDGRGPNGTQSPISHGTAVAEIVHQMAPDATLYLVCIYYSSDGGNVAQYLASQGVTVVNASIGDVLGGRGDGTGDVNSLTGGVAAGRHAGQLWSVSAGNDAQNHFSFTGKDADGDGRVEMFPGTPVAGSPDATEGYSFTLGSGQTSVVDVKWDAWPTSQASNVCFYQDSFAGTRNCPDFYPAAGSGTPVQQTQFTNSTGSSHTYLMAIERPPGTTNNLRFDVWFEGSEGNRAAIIAAGSLTEPATSPFAMTMAAHCFSDGLVEPYSSQGPTIDGRTKPDLSGPDGVSNDVIHNILGGLCGNHPGFYGTSSAAPHGTGAAALIKGAAPSATPDQIESLLVSRGIPAGPPGADNQYGNGRINLGALPFVASAASGPGMASPSPGRTDLFIVGQDGGLWQTTRTSSSGFTPWLPLGGYVTADPDASSWGGGRLDVFVRGGDNALWHRWSPDGQNWSQWESLGGVLASGPTAVERAVNRVDVFVRGTDNAIWTLSWNGSQWSGWSSLGGIATGDPDVASWASNRLDLFVPGTDSAAWHRWWDGAGWSAWESLGGVLAANTGPGVVSSQSGRIDLAAVGSDAALYINAWNGVAWSGWQSRGGIGTSSPDFASPGTNQLDVAVRGSNNAIYLQSFNGAGWTNWSYVGPP